MTMMHGKGARLVVSWQICLGWANGCAGRGMCGRQGCGQPGGDLVRCCGVEWMLWGGVDAVGRGVNSLIRIFEYTNIGLSGHANCARASAGEFPARGGQKGRVWPVCMGEKARKRPKIGVAKKQLQFPKSNGTFSRGTAIVLVCRKRCFSATFVAFPQLSSFDPGKSDLSKTFNQLVYWYIRIFEYSN